MDKRIVLEISPDSPVEISPSQLHDSEDEEEPINDEVDDFD